MPFRHFVLTTAAFAAPVPVAAGAARPVSNPAPACAPADLPDPATLLERAGRAIGIPGPGRVLRLAFWGHVVQDFQSDRSYPPFFSSYQASQAWVDPQRGVERTLIDGGAYPASAFPAGQIVTISGPTAMWSLTGAAVRPLPDRSQAAASRPLDPWLVLAEFRAADRVRTVGRCEFRDYPRIALERPGPFGPERLLLDARSAVPVALLREEPNPLWGQRAVEYVWSNWSLVEGGGLYPLSAFRVVDGETEMGRTVTDAVLQPADSAPSLALPDPGLVLPLTHPLLAGAEPPDTVRVSPSTWLLRTRAYASVVTLQRDTVFVLDATTSEARARQDADWVARLFPGRHPVILVVTDLAWPHIAGVRHWISRGAIVASHRASRAFLERVYARRWTREPDALERSRGRRPLVFRPVGDSIRLAGGAVVLHPIDGISSEGALLAWLPGELFLWASDYVQNLRRPSRYAREVLDAVRRVGIEPARFAAEHLPLSEWSALTALFVASEPASSGAGSGSPGDVSSRPPSTR